MENTARAVADEQAVQSAPDTSDTPDTIESALAHVKAEVASDAASAPAQYLRDSIVPEGGE
jgi:hypothetical protein